VSASADRVSSLLSVMCPDMCVRLGHIVPHIREWDCPSRKLARKIVDLDVAEPLVLKGSLEYT
jgi:hypothetical protein